MNHQRTIKLKNNEIFSGRFRLIISADKMKAYLLPLKSNIFLTRTEKQLLDKELKKFGICHGILEEPIYEPPHWLVAKGFAPEKHNPGSTKILARNQNHKEKRERKAQNKDYREASDRILIKKGECIAENTLPTYGKKGKNIFGEEIENKEDIPHNYLKAGYNVIYNPENRKFYATCTGLFSIRENKFIDVEPLLYIDGDVSWETGNIHFKGQKTLIEGDVKRGFSVISDSDIEIRGDVEDDVLIKTSGNIIINGRINGQNTKIISKKEIYINKVEYATIEAEENVHIKDYALQANIRANKNIFAHKEKGKLIGGTYEAQQNITAFCVGNKSGITSSLIIKKEKNYESKIIILGDIHQGTTIQINNTKTNIRKSRQSLYFWKERNKLKEQKLKKEV